MKLIQVYIEKLRADLVEVSQLKEKAVLSENYTMADAMRSKIISLTEQLNRMETQANTDLLRNCVTQWQGAFATHVSECMKSVGMSLFSKEMGLNVLKTPYHASLVNVISNIPGSYYDAFIRAFIKLTPYEIPDGPHYPYGWAFFAKSIPNYTNKSSEIQEFVKATMTLTVMQMIQMMLSKANKQHEIQGSTHELVIKQVYHYFHAASLRKMNIEIEGGLFDKTFSYCAMILGELETS
jgi:hypothetical protein